MFGRRRRYVPRISPLPVVLMIAAGVLIGLRLVNRPAPQLVVLNPPLPNAARPSLPNVVRPSSPDAVGPSSPKVAGPPLPNVIRPTMSNEAGPTMPATSSMFAGRAYVIDGDTIDVAGHRVRLFGIDAPESAQRCERNGFAYACGETARRQLQAIIGANEVACRVRDTDRYQRAVANCAAGGADLGEAMVRSGWALAYRQYASDYVQAEAEARRQGIGLWAGRFDAPWDWRRQYH
jgi:endonuclease YncB( thermonuclease family)